jgi:hypothetical protein
MKRSDTLYLNRTALILELLLNIDTNITLSDAKMRSQVAPVRRRSWA